ncbi:hypothetical protein HRW14_36200 [Streptomyces lunaelactis]|uniref:hypothetical protein n=1 Tax=Streptomyces lunaelactis TaxID=1535768 RepID=UPI0015859899|nr:hypothetical protein [Streptomyces lunaelactis]NUK55586.1 hypothetical protein [Streptomyces lunaelactis]NUK69287.1 hypothetical protein [Streptomyces lunaelactis]
MTLALSLGLPRTAAGTPAEGGQSAVVATDEIRVSAARVATPSGNTQPVKQTPVPAPRLTGTAEQLAESRSMKPPERPAVPAHRSGVLAPPPLQSNFDGLGQGTSGVRPPDTHGAAGLNHFVEVTNGRGLGMFQKSNGALVKNVTFASFFGYTAQTIFDPRVVYDKKWNRWVVVAEAFQESATIQNVFLAVSTTSDPTGSFYLYKFDAAEPSGDFLDFPQLGMDQDAVIITANIFAGNTYARSRVMGIAKSDIYNGRAFSMLYQSLGAVGSVAPPIVEDNNANAFLVVAGVGSPTVLRLFRASGLGRSNASIAAAVNVPVPAFSLPPDARQPGVADRLDSLDARFQNASTQIGNRLLNVHTINMGNFPTPRWYQINTSTNTVAAGESGILREASDSDDFNPAVAGSSVGGTASNPIGRMFFTWSSTDAVGSGLHHASVKGSGRLATDPVNITGGSTLATAPTPYNPSTSTVERWGDYSAVSIDPVAYGTCAVGQRAWIVNERHVNTTQWGSRFGSFGFC